MKKLNPVILVRDLQITPWIWFWCQRVNKNQSWYVTMFHCITTSFGGVSVCCSEIMVQNW